MASGLDAPPGAGRHRIRREMPGTSLGDRAALSGVAGAHVAEERDDVPEVRVPRSQLAGGEQVRAGTRAHEQPELAGQAAHLADRGVAVHRDYLIDEVPVPGEDAGDEAVGDALDQVPADLAAHQQARLVRLDGDDPAGWIALAEALTHAHD